MCTYLKVKFQLCVNDARYNIQQRTLTLYMFCFWSKLHSVSVLLLKYWAYFTFQIAMCSVAVTRDSFRMLNTWTNILHIKMIFLATCFSHTLFPKIWSYFSEYLLEDIKLYLLKSYVIMSMTTSWKMHRRFCYTYTLYSFSMQRKTEI